MAGLDRVRGEDPAGRPGAATTPDSAAARHRDLDELLEEAPPDREVAAMARTIARRLARRHRSARSAPAVGRGPFVPVPFHHRSDDLDLERTLEALAPPAPPGLRDLVVRERVGDRRDAVLIVDVSGSMRGEKVRIAAATVGALSAQLTAGGDRLAVVAFWSDAAVLAPLGPVTSPARLLETLLRVPAKGLTNVGFGLSVGLAELSRSTLRGRTAYLLTDAVHNAGPDPRLVARRHPRLHVLLQTDGEHDEPLGRDLARLGHGRFASVRHHRDVAPALDRMPGS